MHPLPHSALKCLAISLCFLCNILVSQTLAAQPVITDFSPASGPIGTTVTIMGSGFDNDIAGNTVYFGAVKAIVTAAGSNSLTVTVPGGATFEPLTVTANHLTAYSNRPFVVTFNGAVNQSSATSFSERIEIPNSLGPLHFVMNDLNDDGKPDLVTLTSSEFPTVMENKSTQNVIAFSAEYLVQRRISANCIASGDVDGDGKTDIILAGSGFEIMKNTSSNGKLSLTRDYAKTGLDDQANDIMIRDMDGDGKPDLVALHIYPYNDTSRIYLYKNTTVNGVISFASKIELVASNHSFNFCIGDIDGDAKPDIIVTNPEKNSISVFRNNSSAAAFSFNERTDQAVGQYPYDITLADFDNDGKQDVVVTNRGAQFNSRAVSVLKNTSTTGISFATRVDLLVGDAPTMVEVNDWNGDGYPDLAVINSATLSLFNNNANGTISFTSKQDYPGRIGMNMNMMRSGDLNGDNLPEIITTGSAVTVFRNQVTTSASKFIPPVITSFSPASGAVGSPVTITGTGFSPIAANNIVYFGAVQATVTAASSTSLTVTVPSQSTAKPISVTRDRLTAFSSKPFLVTFAGGDAPFNGDLFAAAADSLETGSVHEFCASDIDGDGKPDLVIPKSGTLSVYRNTGSPGAISFAPKVEIPLTGSAAGVIAADMNGDGKPDLVVRNPRTQVLVNTSTPGSISFIGLYNVGYVNPDFVGYHAVGDFDADGRIDVAISPDNGVGVYKNWMVNDSIFFYVNKFSTGVGADKLAAFDFSGDGRTDFAVEGSSVQQITLLGNQSSPGNLNFKSTLSLPVNTIVGGMTAGDLDGDGKPDIAIVDQNDSTLSIFRNTSTGSSYSFASRVNFKSGVAHGQVTINDLNGDGKLDIVLVNLDDSSFLVFKNKSSAGTLSLDEPVEYKTGHRPIFADAADWDGDGLPDLVVCNNDNTFSFYKNQLYRPVITSFTPALVSPGTVVTINGYNFTNVSEVKFGSVAAQSFTLVSANQVTAVVGEGSEGDITVKTSLGTAALGAVSFEAPVITSFSPLAAPAGSTLTITGAHFSAVPENNHVYFGAVQATISVATTTSLTVQVPVGATSCNAISVSTFNKIGWSARPFVVTFPRIGNTFTSASFESKIDLNVGENSRWVCTGDLDNDGLPDLITANSKKSSISILKNNSSNGKVQFNSADDISLYGSPTAVTMADIDADGKLDVVVATDTRLIYVLVNTSQRGAITFSGPLQFITHYSNTDLATADFDQDGKTDLLIMNDGWSDGLKLMRNTSTNAIVSFSEVFPLDLSGGYNPREIAVEDLNGDGKPDLAVTYQISSNARVFINTGSPGNISFGAGIPIPIQGGWGGTYTPFGIAAGDFDGDGKPDLAMNVNYTASGNSIYLYKNTSSAGAFSINAGPVIPVPSGSSADAMVLGDMDGDGKLDLVTAGSMAGGILLYRNTSTVDVISFQPGVEYDTYSPLRACLVDADLDGKSDIVSVSDVAIVNILRNKTGEAGIQPSGANPVTGPVMNKVVVDTAVQTLNGQPYVQRHYDLVPENNAATATATVTLYFTQAEFDNFNAFPGHGPDLPKNPEDAAGKANMRIYQYHGFSTTSLPGTYTGEGKEINPDDAKIVWNADQQWWEVSFDVDGFSGFFISTVGFNYNQVPIPVITAHGATSFCTGETVTLASNLDKNNQWYKNGVLISGATANTYETGISGTYTVTATYNGVTSPQSLGKTVLASTRPAKPVITQNGAELVSSIINGNQWYLENQIIDGAMGKTYKPAASGNYSVKASDGACTGPESEKYHFLLTGIIDLDDDNFISLTPNPVNDYAILKFKLNGVIKLTVEIVNMQGQVCGKSSVLLNGDALSMAGLPGGVYFVRIRVNKLNYTMKVIKL